MLTTMDDRPVNRCAIKGCPVIGHWPEGALCPIHRKTEPPQWEVDR